MKFSISRREWFAATLAGATARSLAFSAQSSSKAAPSPLAMPGLYRGRVVEVRHPASIVNRVFQREPIEAMLAGGMRELTGAPDVASAWRRFVSPGEVIGIKVNPVGRPHVISSPETLRGIIAGLNAAGISNKDIVVFDRYRAEFLEAGFDKWLPEGVRWSAATQRANQDQQDIAGYDPDHYMEMALVNPGQDLDNPTARRSYAALYITREVDKLINLCVLKDHQSAGITIALKNLSHGLVNNVARSHSTRTLNTCGAFIPAVVALPVIRNKTVLHICDAVKALYHGGPFGRPQFVWEHKTMYFATDPVAMDRIGWDAIDAQRLAVGRKPLAEDLPDQWSTFLRKQPEHAEIAGALGLGEFDRAKIDHRVLRLG
jgi:uncharacterized protein (DUF362 family)